MSIKGIVIDDDGRILLSLEDNGKWEMLGGGLDHGEDPITGLKRKILEETGLERCQAPIKLDTSSILERTYLSA